METLELDEWQAQVLTARGFDLAHLAGAMGFPGGVMVKKPDYVTLEVRCCCTPGKRLGYVQVPVDAIRVGKVNLVVNSERGPLLVFGKRPSVNKSSAQVLIADIKTMEESVVDYDVAAPAGAGMVVRDRRTFPAVSSMDQPLEVWKRIDAFREDQT